MLKGLKYRLYPTNSQKELIAKHIGSSHFQTFIKFSDLSIINTSFCQYFKEYLAEPQNGSIIFLCFGGGYKSTILLLLP